MDDLGKLLDESYSEVLEYKRFLEDERRRLKMHKAVDKIYENRGRIKAGTIAAACVAGYAYALYSYYM